MMKLLISGLAIFIFYSCSESSSLIYQPAQSVNSEFSDIWFDGKAEIASYALTQNRYGSPREGYAVLITVTEPFNGDLQVKADQGATRSYDVLKTNLIKRFTTGIYDYSTMTSTFCPLNTNQMQPAAKVSCSIQDWCGQTYAQCNRRRDAFKVAVHSYFEDEVHEEQRIKGQLLQDAIFSVIRMDPQLLPTGKVSVILSMENCRYTHKPAAPIEMKGELKGLNNSYQYSLIGKAMKLQWTFKKVAPYQITSWREVKLDDSGNEIPKTETRATLVNQIRSSYWGQNGSWFQYLRDSLGLPAVNMSGERRLY